MSKSEPKTMRFENDVEQYINAQKGDNFSEKFHMLVRKFKDDEINLEKKIKALDNEIKTREKRLRELNEILGKGDWLERSFKDLRTSIDRSRKSLDSFLLSDIEKKV